MSSLFAARETIFSFVIVLSAVSVVFGNSAEQVDFDPGHFTSPFS